jgi:hypothetical protein
VKLKPGTYRATKPLAWKSFTLFADGAVEFIDAGDGHKVYWGTRGSDGPAWFDLMAKMLADGTLVKEDDNG